MEFVSFLFPCSLSLSLSFLSVLTTMMYLVCGDLHLQLVSLSSDWSTVEPSLWTLLKWGHLFINRDTFSFTKNMHVVDFHCLSTSISRSWNFNHRTPPILVFTSVSLVSGIDCSITLYSLLLPLSLSLSSFISWAGEEVTPEVLQQEDQVSLLHTTPSLFPSSLTHSLTASPFPFQGECECSSLSLLASHGRRLSPHEAAETHLPPFQEDQEQGVLHSHSGAAPGQIPIPVSNSYRHTPIPPFRKALTGFHMRTGYS